jgi:ABC-type molybdate transport system substrate-binding protein
MPQEQQVLRGTCIGLLSFSTQPELARRFMDFLTTSAARKFYEQYGWVVPRA